MSIDVYPGLMYADSIRRSGLDQDKDRALSVTLEVDRALEELVQDKPDEGVPGVRDWFGHTTALVTYGIAVVVRCFDSSDEREGAYRRLRAWQYLAPVLPEKETYSLPDWWHGKEQSEEVDVRRSRPRPDPAWFCECTRTVFEPLGDGPIWVCVRCQSVRPCWLFGARQQLGKFVFRGGKLDGQVKDVDAIGKKPALLEGYAVTSDTEEDEEDFLFGEPMHVLRAEEG